MKTWNNMDKSEWIDGEWNEEPDKAHWVDKKTGLDCLIVRNRIGSLCGYVGVANNNKFFEKDYNDVDVEVHGGLTFADRCRPQEDEGKGICHPKEGVANEIVWWLGFDCCHCWDMSPAYDKDYCDSTYRNFKYVKREVTSLAEQLTQ